ncbi:MAG: phage major capsid protein [Nitrospira sp.]|nr:phage major capsid protein [Nitrospira sp.]MBS0175825.1 phage major capsid protein [Nitrospira sp.]MBX3336444.1 phage major capsid protein [Nitrospira sp.]MCW5778977.1 phage major capsid protein [Nitrospira sp.]
MELKALKDLDREMLELSLMLKQLADSPGSESKERALMVSEERDRLLWRKAQHTAFEKYLRDQSMTAFEQKALHSLQSTTGGYSVSPLSAMEILSKAQMFAPIRQYATVRTLLTGDAYPLPKETSRPDVRWVTETDPRPLMNGLTFGGELIPTHIMNTTFPVAAKLLEDPAFDLEEWLINWSVLTAFLEEEAKQFLVGNGIGAPEGLLVRPGVGEVKSGSATTLTVDGVSGLYHQLPQVFRRRAVWLMNAATLRVLSGLKDTDGQPVLRQTTTGDTILGRPVLEDPNMPDIASGAWPIAFGDLSYYWIIDRIPLAVLRDPFSNKPNVVFDCVRRVGGQLVEPAAVVKQVISA